MLAAQGQWVTNEKTLLDRAGLRGIDGILTGLAPDPRYLAGAVDAAIGLLQASLPPRTIDAAPPTPRADEDVAYG